MVLQSVKAILWDFDGVILNSLPVRDEGYRQVLRNYSEGQVEELLVYQHKNGGLSRYVKFRFFYENILNEQVSSEKINYLAQRYSDFMVEHLIDRSLLIRETMEFIKSYHDKIPMHIVSASDQKELRYLCTKLEIKHFFKSINGSPTPKKENVKKILEGFNHNPKTAILIGDSINDYEAARENEIKFLGFNNNQVKNKGIGYVDNFMSISIEL